MDSYVDARSVQSSRADFQDAARYSGRRVAPALLVDHLPLSREADNAGMAGTLPALPLQATERRPPARAEVVAKGMMGYSRCPWNAHRRQKSRWRGYLCPVLPASSFLRACYCSPLIFLVPNNPRTCMIRHGLQRSYPILALKFYLQIN